MENLEFNDFYPSASESESDTESESGLDDSTISDELNLLHNRAKKIMSYAIFAQIHTFLSLQVQCANMKSLYSHKPSSSGEHLDVATFNHNTPTLLLIEGQRIQLPEHDKSGCQSEFRRGSFRAWE